MGQFSWYTQDTNEPIYNDWDQYGDRQTVHMVDPRDGHDYIETGYEGYGRFGGMDYYVLLAYLNKDLVKKIINEDTYHKFYDKELNELNKEEQSKIRIHGIQIEYDIRVKLYPILVMNYSNWKNYIGYRPKMDPNQGWHINEDDEDDIL